MQGFILQLTSLFLKFELLGSPEIEMSQINVILLQEFITLWNILLHTFFNQLNGLFQTFYINVLTFYSFKHWVLILCSGHGGGTVGPGPKKILPKFLQALQKCLSLWGVLGVVIVQRVGTQKQVRAWDRTMMEGLGVKRIKWQMDLGLLSLGQITLLSFF